MLARTSLNPSQAFTICVLADLIGTPTLSLPMKQRRLVEVTPESIPVYRAHLERTFGSTPNDETDSAWAGLALLTAAVAGRSEIKVKALAASKRDVLKDLQRAMEFDQSGLYKHIYEAHVGTFGGEPVCCITAAYRFTHHPDDLELLDRMLTVAGSAYTPLLHGMTAEFMEVLTAPEVLWSKLNQSTETSSVVHHWDERRRNPAWRFSFPLYPWVRTTESLISPAYLMAGIVAKAVTAEDPMPFPDHPSITAANIPSVQAELEADYPHPWGTLLTRSGITLLTQQRLNNPAELVASSFSSGFHPESVIGSSLAEILFIGWIWRNLSKLVRTRRTDSLGLGLQNEIDSWLKPHQHWLTPFGTFLVRHELTIEDYRLNVQLHVEGHSWRASDYQLTFDFHPNPAERVKKAVHAARLT